MNYNPITFDDTMPKAALLLSFFAELDPYEPEYFLTEENICLLTEDLLSPQWRDNLLNDVRYGRKEIEADHPELVKLADKCEDAIRSIAAECGAGYEGKAEYYPIKTGGVRVLFTDYINHKAKLGTYKTKAAAEGQVTKFLHGLRKYAGNRTITIKTEGRHRHVTNWRRKED